MNDVKTLRETFYKFFFTNYKTFVTGKMCFGERPKFVNANSYENPYNRVLMHIEFVNEAGEFICASGRRKKLESFIDTGFEDKELANSVDSFFDICSTERACDYISDLFSFHVDGGTGNDQRNLQIEDEMLGLILKHFWGVYGKDKQLGPQNYVCDTFFRLLEGRISRRTESRLQYQDVLDAIEALLGIDGSNVKYKPIANFLRCVKEMRNIAAHIFRELDYYDATIVNQFKLYSFLTTILYLRKLLKEENDYSIDLHVICGENKVKLLENGNDITPSGIAETGGWKFSVKRYHTYKISIPGKFEMEFKPQWFSLSPTVFYKEEWEYVHNEFEMDCKMKNATYATIQDMNEKNLNLLSEINTTLNKVEATAREMNTKLESNEKLYSIDKKMDEAVKALGQLVGNMQKFIEGSMNGETMSVDDREYMDGLCKEAKEIHEEFQNSIKSIEKGIKGNRKWIKFFGFSNLTLLLVLLVFSIIVIFGLYFIMGNNKSAEELVSEGNSFLALGDSVAAEEAYKNAIDAFNKQLDNKDEERIKLARKYMDSGNIEIAYNLILPLVSNVKGQPDAALAAAEIMFEKGDYHGVKTMVNTYRSIVNDSTPAIDCLEGLLYIKGAEAGYPKDNEMGGELIAKAANAGDMLANYWMGCILTEDLNEWNPLPDRDHKYVINMTAIDIATGVDCLRKAAPTVLKAALKLGQVYADLNMTDSAEIYFNKVLNSSEEGLDLNNQAKFGLGLLLEKKGEKDNTFMHSLLVAKYKDAMLHDALKSEKPEAIIDIFSLVDYTGPRYLSPKALAYLALGEKEEALQTLTSQHKDGGFNMDFVNGLEKLLGTKYAYPDSLQGMLLMKQAADKGCDYARMLCLYRDIEYNLIDKSKMEIMDVIALENLGSKIPFAYVLASHMFSEANIIGRAQWAALKAMSSRHPAGALAIASAYSKFKPTYFEKIWKDEGECAKFYNTIQAALMKSPYKKNCTKLSFLTDKAKYDLHKEHYPQYRLAFWTDVAIANHFTYLEYFILNAWNQYNKSLPEVESNKKKLSCAILNDLDLSNISDQQQLEPLQSVLNDMTSSEIDSIKEQFKGKINALKIIESRKHYEPQTTYKDFNVIINLKLPIQIRDILFEFSDVIEKDKFSTYFETFNLQK